jgi:hypothetical protein
VAAGALVAPPPAAGAELELLLELLQPAAASAATARAQTPIRADLLPALRTRTLVILLSE